MNMEKKEKDSEQEMIIPPDTLQEIPKENATKGFIREYVIPLAVQTIILLLLLKYVFFLTNVPSGSMLPTIELNSWLFATRMHTPQKTVSRGDIIVFESDELDLTLIKRCVGLPGETVTIDTEGKVFIDGELLDEPYVVFPSGEEETRSFEIPLEHYLFLGDNRNGSIDARYWENPFTPASALMGEAHFTLYPFKNFGMLN